MRRCALPLPILIALALGASPGCGKRADPLAPYLKNPVPPSGLEVSQQGDSVEIRIIAPRTTIQSRPLPVIELEWFQAPALGDFRKSAVPILREEVAPGELRIKRFPIPATDARFSVQAYNGNARSLPAPPVAFKPAPVPAAPRGVEAVNVPTGVELRWTNPPGAEPWPTATPTPMPSPSPSPSLSPGAAPLTPAVDFPGAKASLQPAESQSEPAYEPPMPTPPPLPLPTPTSTPTPDAVLLPDSTPLTESPALPSASPAPSPTPTPTPVLVLPTAIRIFRTDGTPRLARAPLQASSWLDTSVRPGERVCYSLRYASPLTPLVESAPTEPVCLEVKDLVLPEPPERLLGDIGDSFVELSWPPSPSEDVDFYRVYRTAEWEARAMIIQTEGLLLRVRDLRMTPGPRTYEVTAVDKGGNESPPSPPVRIILP
jgi:hypothetical protein